MTAPVITSHNPEAGTVTIRRATWSATVKAADLPDILALYRDLAERRHPRFGDPGAYQAHFQPMIEALERVAAEAGVPIPPQRRRARPEMASDVSRVCRPTKTSKATQGRGKPGL